MLLSFMIKNCTGTIMTGAGSGTQPKISFCVVRYLPGAVHNSNCSQCG